PGIDGYDICKIIKQDPAKRKIPVIMLTSNSSPADRVKGKLAGCDTYLIKPVQHAVFEEVVQECLSAASTA
ncbi:MAG: response regulator, partial [Gammaproteobacteria bacterium]|nr:response regulator [Gammaproteobacteria bacterium]